MKGDRAEQCRLKFFDLQERVIPEFRLRNNFVICTWKVRATFAFYINPVRNQNINSYGPLVDRIDRVVPRTLGVYIKREGLFGV